MGEQEQPAQQHLTPEELDEEIAASEALQAALRRRLDETVDSASPGHR